MEFLERTHKELATEAEHLGEAWLDARLNGRSVERIENLLKENNKERLKVEKKIKKARKKQNG